MTKIRSKISSHFLLLILLISSSSQAATKAPIPQSMGSLGDSITAGFLSKHNRGQLVTPQALFLVQQLKQGIWMRPKKHMEYRNANWACGTEKSNGWYSHANIINQLRKKSGQRPLQTFNGAISGDIAQGVWETQVPTLHQWSSKNIGQNAPDYVTILIGANDICADDVHQMTPVANYARYVELSALSLLHHSPRTRVLLVALPNIENLRNVAKTENVLAMGPLKCQQLWQNIGICPTLTTIEGPDRALIHQRVIDYNRSLANLSIRLRRRFGDRIRFAPHSYNVSFGPEHLSIDCFHPSPSGHRLLSHASWHSAWW